MPEGPEVTWYARTFNKLFTGFTLETIEILRGPYTNSDKSKYSSFREDVGRFTGARISNISCKGKVLFFMFETHPECKPIAQHRALMIHHGMSGSWARVEKNSHTILTLKLRHRPGATLETLHFQDLRYFGTFKFLSADEYRNECDRLGPDIFTVEFEEFNRRFHDRTFRQKYKKWMICDVLLEQNFIAGIGNYLRADILYDARLDPKSMFVDLKISHIVQLYVSMWRIATESLDCRSTSHNDYENVVHPGKYEHPCYGRKTCENGTPVETFEGKNKRTVYYAPEIQTWRP